MPRGSFSSAVAARTRAAAHILATPDVLSRYLTLGGRASDLEKIRDFGQAAEALNSTQGQVMTDGKVATLEYLLKYQELSNTYSFFMGAIRAELGDMRLERVSESSIRRVEQILVNEAEVGVAILENEDGTKSRKVRIKATQEANRAEIQRDLEAVLAFPELAARLEQRTYTRARLEQMRDDAISLAGKVASRTAKKGEGKEATAAEHDAVDAQTTKWGTVYRLLLGLAQQSEPVRALLAEAALATGRKRKSK